MSAQGEREGNYGPVVDILAPSDTPTYSSASGDNGDGLSFGLTSGAVTLVFSALIPVIARLPERARLKRRAFFFGRESRALVARLKNRPGSQQKASFAAREFSKRRYRAAVCIYRKAGRRQIIIWRIFRSRCEFDEDPENRGEPPPYSVSER